MGDLLSYPLSDEMMIDSFSKMSPFDIKWIQQSCGDLYDYLGKIKGADIQTIQTRRQTLISRTNWLMERLNKLHKLDRHPPKVGDQCHFVN
jgi:hypothetical protein